MLNAFLKNILGMDNKGLVRLLRKFQGELEYEDLVYLLAVEDYNIFHSFMHEANQKADREAARKLKMQVQTE